MEKNQGKEVAIFDTIEEAKHYATSLSREIYKNDPDLVEIFTQTSAPSSPYGNNRDFK